MVMKTISRHGLEKLSQPVTCAGLTAEVAEVTRYFQVDIVTGAEAEYGTPEIFVLWGATVADTVADLERRKTEALEKAADEAERFDELAESLTKKAVEK
jgi:hypothetical protein